MAKDWLSHQRAKGERSEEMQLPTQKHIGEPDWSEHPAVPEKLPGHPKTPSMEPA